MAMTDKLGVYVSVPFCRAKCSFCNFASGVGSAAEIERYVGRLCAEIAGAEERAVGLGAELPRGVDTVYFGGGTPSLLTPGQMGRIFGALRGVFAVDGDAEITLEAAPGQIAEDVLEASLRLGVNRVSLGVQSFVDREAAAVGRSHTGESCLAEIARLRAAGVAQVGVDLIAGLPYQTRESWEVSLAAVVGAGLTHVSVYMLEVDEESRLGAEVMAGGKRFHAHGVPAEEMAAELYERACAVLPAAGLAQYEISNFAREGSRSRHNLRYWQRAPYLGVGLDAHSMLVQGLGIREQGLGEAVRFANADELATYALPGGRGEIVRVGEVEALEERVFLGLRMVDGVALDAMLEEGARELVREGLMWEREGRWGLTLRGRLISNEVFGRLLEAVAV
jgi:oxygen-independent coproporphyrinogen-3 oxidase